MTTICYRRYEDRVEFACDSKVSFDNRFYKDRKWFGETGTSGAVLLYSGKGDNRNWIESVLKSSAGEELPGAPTDQGQCLVLKGGKVFTIAMATKPEQVELGLEYWGCGSGGDLAVGAIACGKSPGEAVAMVRDQHLDCHTGMEVHQFRMAPDGTITKMESL